MRYVILLLKKKGVVNSKKYKRKDGLLLFFELRSALAEFEVSEGFLDEEEFKFLLTQQISNKQKLSKVQVEQFVNSIEKNKKGHFRTDGKEFFLNFLLSTSSKTPFQILVPKPFWDGCTILNSRYTSNPRTELI